MDEMLKKLAALLKSMTRIEKSGFPDEAQAGAYFEEKEQILEEMGAALGALKTGFQNEVEALKGTVKLLKDNLKESRENPTVLTKDQFYRNLGQTIAGVWLNNPSLLGKLQATPNLKGENWTNPNELAWEVGKGWVNKAALGAPMGDLATNDQYLINPIYETQIMTDARDKSVMMSLVHNRPMAGPSIFLPQRDRGGVILNWLTSYGQQIGDSKPQMGQRVELKAYTLAGYIPWYDEFEEDIYADLGKMFVEEFIDAYAREFDTQCLTASAAPFTGVMAHPDATAFRIKSSSPYGMTYLDLRNAVLKVPAEERKDCAWFMNETVLSGITSMQDTEGRPLWRGPNQNKPGTLDGYPYYESKLLPQASEIKKNQSFAVFMNPKRIKHGNRKGMELKRFDGTSESLQYSEIFLRFRKRDGFLVTRAKNNMVVLKCQNG